MKEVQAWRQEGLEAYFTINTGQDIHVICRKIDIQKISKKLSSLKEVSNVIVNYPSKGAHLVQNHLF